MQSINKNTKQTLNTCNLMDETQNIFASSANQQINIENIEEKYKLEHLWKNVPDELWFTTTLERLPKKKIN